MAETKEVGPRSLVQGLISPESWWPPDQLAGKEGQGHLQQFWPTAAHPGVVFFLLFGAAVNFPSVGWMLAREDGGGGTLEAGGEQGHPQFGSWTVRNRVTPSLVAGRCGTGSPHDRLRARPV